jgi:hypothetical protein
MTFGVRGDGPRTAPERDVRPEEIAADSGTLARLTEADWAGTFTDAFDRAAGFPIDRGPIIADPSSPEPAAVAEANSLLRTTFMSIFRQPQSFPGAVAKEIAKLDPSSPVIEQVFRHVPALFRKALIDRTFDELAIERMNRLTLPARETIVELAARGIVGPADRATYDALIGRVHDDRLAQDLARLETAEGRAAMIARAKSLGDETTVRYGGVEIGVDKPAEHQAAIEQIYKMNERIGNHQTTPPEVAMARPLSKSLATGEPAHIDFGIWRPGLGNEAPSASCLFRAAQYCDKLILAYECTDGTAASKLRPLAEFMGFPVPPELEGKLFAIGTADHRFQDSRRGAGVFIAQLDEIARDGEELGLPKTGYTVIAHSQGNKETVLARETLAANGFPDVITRHIGLAPAVRGSFFANDPLLEAKLRAIAGEVAAGAITDLRTEYSEARIPEYLRLTVDTVMMGLVQGEIRPAFVSPLMRISNVLTNKNLSGMGSDGLVDLRGRDYVKDPTKFYLSKTAYDHMSIVNDPAAIDELMKYVEPTDPESLDVLRRLAQP